MKWTELLRSEMDKNYAATRGLMQLAEGENLSWKPSQGSNWMTLGELLQHCTIACGWCCDAFLTGKWDPPKSGFKPVKSAGEAIKLLDTDRKLALKCVDKAGEARLEEEIVQAPWGTETTLGVQFLDMAQHLNIHKAQLFYYLKMLGKPVHTGNMWGLASTPQHADAQ